MGELAMKTPRTLPAAFLLSLIAGVFAGQPIAHASGSPAQSLDQSVLPIPEPAFRGKIGLTPADSKKDFPQPVTPPKGAPNVLIIMTDDVGFAASEVFGGSIPTPALDRVAKAGLRYNTFHTTAQCSPTRAALLTGRNHHTAGTGSIMEMGVGYPGYNTVVSKQCELPASQLDMPDVIR
jgi:arylsulfatase